MMRVGAFLFLVALIASGCADVAHSDDACQAAVARLRTCFPEADVPDLEQGCDPTAAAALAAIGNCAALEEPEKADWHGPGREGCLLRHVSEALLLNRERRETYELLSDGESLAVSDALIGTELLALPVAAALELVAIPHWAHGVPVLCEDVVSMDLVPVLQEWTEPGVAPPLGGFPVAQWRDEIRAALHDDGFAAAHEVARDKLAQLADWPQFHCLTRHLLESLARVSALAPQYETIAAARGSRSPRWLSARLMDTHLLALTTADRIDTRAVPLQARGIAIICQDLPPIPIEPTLVAE